MLERLPIIEAWLANKPEAVLRIADQARPDDPLAPAYHVMRLCFQRDTGQAPSANLTAACEKALSAPPSDPCLHQFVLRAAIYQGVYENRLADAQAYLNQAKTNASGSEDPIVCRPVNQMAYVVARARDDYPGQLEALNNGLAEIDEPDRIAAIPYHIWRFQAAYENHDLDLAKADLDAIAKRRDELLAHRHAAYPLLEAAFLQRCGEHRAAEQSLRAMTQAERDSGRAMARYIEATNLIHQHRMDEAGVLIEAMWRQASKSPSDSYNRFTESQAAVQSLRAELALGRGDADRAWCLADELAETATNEHARWKIQAKQVLIDAALAQRNPALANRLLTAIDPEYDRPAFRVPWVRLHWLTDEQELAAQGFAALMRETREYPGYVPAQLRFASELSAQDTARLYRYVDRLAGIGSNGLHRQSTEIPASGTLARRDRVLALFRTHRRLTRAQVIQQIGCAPNTATRDLAALLSEGHIQRHNPSSHARTSYFTYRDSSQPSS